MQSRLEEGQERGRRARGGSIVIRSYKVAGQSTIPELYETLIRTVSVL